jgi:hypothetical protein
LLSSVAQILLFGFEGAPGRYQWQLRGFGEGFSQRAFRQRVGSALKRSYFLVHLDKECDN